MKSTSADPDFVRMSRFKVAMEAWVRWISSVTMAGSVPMGSGRPPAGVGLGLWSGRVGMKSRRARIALQRVPDQRIALSP